MAISSFAQNQYYVNGSGNDANSAASVLNSNGAVSWKTIQHALNTESLGASGTTIHVAAGTYSDAAGCFGVAVCFTHGGSSTSVRLVLQCDTPLQCFLHSTIWFNGASGVNDIDVTGFDVGNMPNSFNALAAANNGTATSYNSIHILGNFFHDVGQSVVFGGITGCINDGMVVLGAPHGSNFSNTDIQVIGNRLNNFGIVGNGCINGQGIYMGSAGAIVQNNIIGNITTSCIEIFDQPGHQKIVNNTCFHSGRGIQLAGQATFSGTNTVSNNVVVNILGNAIMIDSGSGGTCPVGTLLLTHNIFSGNTTNIFGNGTCETITGNITTETPSTTFVNFQNNGTGDYHIKSGSLAIAGGTTSCIAGGSPCSPTTDFSGTVRPNPPSIGAYEFVGSGSPVISLSAASLSFGNQNVNTASPSQNEVVTNVGTSSLTISSIGITGNFSQTNNCPANLGASLSCTIVVTFAPLSAGPLTGTLTVTDNASGSPHTVPLSGTGTTSIMGLTPPSINFGSSTIGTPTGAQFATLKNNGTANITLVNSVFSGTNAADFQFAGTGTCSNGNVLAPNASCTDSIQFSPIAAGARTAILTVSSDASNSPLTVTLSGTGTTPAPSVSLAPTSLTFTPQLVNTTSASQTVTLTNNGTASLTISSTSASGDFARTTTCGATLAVNTSCTLSVTFTPTAVGTRNGTLSITDNASGSPHTVSLTGTGTAGATLFAPTSITFGSQTVGSSTASVTERLTNNGTATLTGIGVTLTGTNPGDFGIVNSCPSSLAVNASCNVAVSFTPTTTGSRTANIHFISSALNSPQDVALSGTGAAATASVTLSPTSVSFANQATGTTSTTQIILLTSSGSATLTISSVTKTGPDASQFNLTNPCAASLSPGNNCTLLVSFSPTTVGAKTAAITITDNAGDSPQVVNLTGNGSSPPAAVASLSTTSLTFGSRNVNSASAAQIITVNSTGTASLVISSVTSSGDYSQTNNCGTVPAGSSCTINVTFTPTAVGTRTGTVNITDNAADSPQTVSLSGTGLGSTGIFAPTSLSFGNQGVATASVAQGTTLSNSGNIAETVAFSFSGANPSNFSETDNCAGSLAAGASCLVSVTFTPTAIGSRTGNLVVTGSALNSPQTVALSGTGVQASLSISPTLFPFGNQAVGTSSNFLTSTVTNVGTAPSHITSVTIAGPNSAEFSIGTNTCVTTLQPTTSCNILVRFSPATIGTKSAAVTIVDDAPGSPHMISLTGTGTSVIAVFSPTPISFGNQPVGTQSAGVSSTLTNTGTADYVISAIVIGSGGNPSDFSESNSCPGTLTAGSSCVITAKFLPTAAGSRVATINVTGTINANLPLSGTGTLPNASFSVNPVAFGNQGVATGVTKTTVLTNTGLAPLHISSSSLVKTGCSADLADTFSTGSLDGSKWLISTGNAPGNIAGVNAGSFSTSNVDLSQGVLTMRVTQSGNAPVVSSGAQIQSVNTFGFGTFEWILRSASSATSPAGAGLPTSGQISSGFNFINNSQTEIDFEIEGQFPSLVEQTTWFTTATNQETNYTAPFQPDQGFHHYKFVWFPGIVQFFVDGVLSATHTNNVPVTPAFVLMNIWGTNSTSFGGNAVVGTARRMFVSGFTHTPATCGVAVGYTQTNNCPGTLNPSSSCTYNVTFTPTAAGENDAFLQVVTDAPVTPSLVSLTGNGIAPTIVLSPPSFDYGNVALGVTVPETFVVLNSGTGPAMISSVSVPAGDFSILSQNCVGTLAAGNSCSIVVNFIPSVASVRTSTLTVADNAAGNPHTAALRGTGINTGGQTSLILGGAMDAGGNLQVGVH